MIQFKADQVITQEHVDALAAFINQQSNTICEKDVIIAKKAGTISELVAAVKELTLSISQKDEEMSKRDIQLDDIIETLKRNAVTLDAQTAYISQQTATIKFKNEELSKRIEIINKKTSQIKNQYAKIKKLEVERQLEMARHLTEVESFANEHVLKSIADASIPVDTPQRVEAPEYKELLTENQIMSLAYDCCALPEVITDRTLFTFARAIEALVRA